MLKFFKVILFLLNYVKYQFYKIKKFIPKKIKIKNIKLSNFLNNKNIQESNNNNTYFIFEVPSNETRVYSLKFIEDKDLIIFLLFKWKRD